MKKIATAAALAFAGLGLMAPLASADTPPPVVPGQHAFDWNNGHAMVNIALDCGPDCFSLSDPSTRDEYRFDPVMNRWFAAGPEHRPIDGHLFRRIATAPPPGST